MNSALFVFHLLNHRSQHKFQKIMHLRVPGSLFRHEIPHCMRELWKEIYLFSSLCFLNFERAISRVSIVNTALVASIFLSNSNEKYIKNIIAAYTSASAHRWSPTMCPIRSRIFGKRVKTSNQRPTPINTRKWSALKRSRRATSKAMIRMIVPDTTKNIWRGVSNIWMC